MLKIGDAVRVRSGSELAPLLAEAAGLTGTVGDSWTDDTGARVSVVYEDAQIYVGNLPADAFEPAPAP